MTSEKSQAQIADLKNKFQAMETSFQKVVIGQQEVMRLLNVSILSNGHSLITGAPGLAKTLAVKTISKLLDLESRRIQFTPDLLPSDIIGVEILDMDPVKQTKEFRYIKGPVFTNVLLADEINRATPRTQSALLEAMQEKNVTLGGENYKLDPPFIVFATRNPIDSEGVYPLPEAQLDRFLLEIIVPYPNQESEWQIAAQDHNALLDNTTSELDKASLLEFQNIVSSVPIPESVLKKSIQWIRNTRPQNNADIADTIAWGAGPRAAFHLMHACRAYALLYDEGIVTEQIVKKMFPHVIRHRIVTTAIFQRSGKEVDEILDHITST